MNSSNLPPLKFSISGGGLFTQKTADGIAANIFKYIKMVALLPSEGMKINITPDGTTAEPIFPKGTTTTTTTTPSVIVTAQNCTVTLSDTFSVNATFIVTLSAVQTSDVTISYSTVDITAFSGTDYDSASGTATIAAGSLFTTVEVTVLASSSTASSSFGLTMSSTDATVSGVGICSILPMPVAPSGDITINLGGSISTPFLAVPAVVATTTDGSTSYAVNIYFGSGIVKTMSGTEIVVSPEPELGITSSGILAICLTLDGTTGVAISAVPSIQLATWTAPTSTSTTVWTAVSKWTYTAGSGIPSCVGYSLHGSFSHFYDSGVSTLTPL